MNTPPSLDTCRLIGISGKIGAGKTTLAHHIIDQQHRRNNRAVERHAFADLLPSRQSIDERAGRTDSLC